MVVVCRGGKAWKVPLVLLSLAAAAAGGYFGWKHYEEQKEIDKKTDSKTPAKTAAKKK